MEIKIKVSTIYKCSLERAFKTPLLCDVSKVHTGFGLMPKVTHCTEDENWGQIGSSKKVYAAKSLTQKGGFASVDKIFNRIENDYWKFQVDDFQSWMLGFYKFVGEWKTTEIEPNNIWFIIHTHCIRTIHYFFHLIGYSLIHFGKCIWNVF